MRIKFWGTRGSIAKPDPKMARYGGNTSCVEIRSDAGTLIVIDCGTGGHALGHALVAQARGAIDGHLLISHTHWDHIQGIPFFAPLFVAGNTWDIHGPKGLSQSLRTTLAGQMEHTYFPVTLEQFAATIRYHDLVEGVFDVGDVRVTARYLNHPALTLGYRLEADGASLVYCCDHEPHSTSLAAGEAPMTGSDRRYAEFVAGADLVVHDAQYTAREYKNKVGWGHSPVEYAIRVCRDAGVRKLVLTHHDPTRNDAAIDAIIADVRERLRADDSPLEVLAAAEGLGIDVRGDAALAKQDPQNAFRAKTEIGASTPLRPVLLHMASGSLRDAVAQAIDSEGLRCRCVADRDELLHLIPAERPALVMIGHEPPEADGEEIARLIRCSEGIDTVQVPIVLVAEGEPAISRAGGIATDWLLAPFSASYARTKIRAWALRTACRWIRAQSPEGEGLRLTKLHALGILDTEPEERFDRVTRIAAATFDVPIALISLVDRNRQWFKSCFGLGVRETSRDAAFCAHVVQANAEMIVPDALLDERFADNPLVVDEPRIRFYAGAPLILEDGSCIGTLCLIDTRPRDVGPADLATLRDLRDLACDEITRARERAPRAAPQPGARPTALRP